MLERIGVPGKKVCFERQRLDRLRVLAAAGEKPPPAASRVTAPLPAAPAPVTAAPATTAGAAALAVLAEPPPPPPPPPDAPGAGAAAAVAAGGSVIGAAASAPAAAAPMEVEIVSGANVLDALRGRGKAGAGVVASAEAAPPSARELNRRQAAWAAKLAARERFVVEDVTFVGRAPRFERQSGLIDLAAALAARQEARVKIEGFVDAGKTPREDVHDSMELARAAGRRLVELGVSRDRVTWAGRGRDAPVAPNFTVRGREANRRIEVVPLP
jgi:outer membrane protein OmpA-like peptidoglycan-associated protein